MGTPRLFRFAGVHHREEPNHIHRRGRLHAEQHQGDADVLERPRRPAHRRHQVDGLAGRNDDDLPEERNPRGLLHAAGRDQHAQITPRRRFRRCARRTRPDQQEHPGRQGRTMAQTIHRNHLLGQGRHQTGHRRRRLRGGRRNPGQRSRQPGRTRTSRRPDPRMSRLRPHETLPASGLDVRRPGQLHPAVRL